MFLKTNFIGVALATFVAVGLTACSSMPDSDVKAVLSQIAKEQRWVSKDAKLKYDGFITQFRNKDTKQIGCRARVTINGSRTNYVDYRAQYTDDGHLYVEALWD